MANILGLITVNEKDLIEVDGVPSDGTGTPAPVGSMAMHNDGNSGQMYIKTDVLDTGWDRIQTEKTSGKSDSVSLDPVSVAEKRITLPRTPSNPEKVLVIPVGGPPQVNGIDYIVYGNVISWSGLGMDGILSEDDKLVVYY